MDSSNSEVTCHHYLLHNHYHAAAARLVAHARKAAIALLSLLQR